MTWLTLRLYARGRCMAPTYGAGAPAHGALTSTAHGAGRCSFSRRSLFHVRDGSTSLTLTPWCGRSKFDGSRGVLMLVLPFGAHLRAGVPRSGIKFDGVPVGRKLLGSGLRGWTLPGVLVWNCCKRGTHGHRFRRSRLGAWVTHHLYKGRDL